MTNKGAKNDVYFCAVHVFIDIGEYEQNIQKLEQFSKDIAAADAIAQFGHWTYDRESNAITLSSEISRLYKLSQDQITLRTLLELLHPAEHKKILNIMRDTGSIFETEFRIYINEQTRWIYVTGRKYFDSEGNILKSLGTVQDITRHKQSLPIETDKDLFQGIFSRSQDGMLLFKVRDAESESPQFWCHDVNRAFLQQFKVDKDKVLHRSFQQLFSKRAQGWVNYLDKALKEQTSTSWEIYRPSLERYFNISVYSPRKDFIILRFHDITTTKQDEDQFKTSDLHLNILMENSVDTFWITSTQLKPIIISNSASVMRGFPMQEIYNQTLEEKLTNSSYKHFFKQLKPFLKQVQKGSQSHKPVLDIDLDFRHKNGGTVPTKVRITPVYDTEQNPVAFVGVNRQVHPENSDSASAKKPAAQPAGFQNIGLWCFDAETEAFLVTQKTLELINYEKTHIENIYSLKDWVHFVVHPDDKARVFKTMQQALQNGQGWETSYTLKTSSGSKKTVYETSQVELDSKKRIVRIWGILQDRASGQTGQAEHNHKDRSSQEQTDVQEQMKDRYKMLLDQIPIRIACLDRFGALMYANSTYYSSLGFTETEFKDQTESVLVHPEYRDEFIQALQSIQKKKNISLEYRIKDKQGDWQQMQACASLLTQADDAFCSLWVIRPVSEIKQELPDQQPDEFISQLPTTISGDFTDILQVIGNYNDIILDSIPREGTAYECARNIKDTCDNGASMVRRLIHFSAPKKIKFRKTDINILIYNLTRTMDRLFGPTLKIRFIPDVNIKPINVDSEQIEDMLMNLCMNARDATDEDGQIIIHTRNRIFEQDNPHDLPVGHYIMISVQDNGPGIPADLRDKIFEPFFTTKTAPKAIGLGLSIVNNIARQHKGIVELDPKTKEGALFNVYLPVNNSSAPAVNTDDYPGGDETILIADDEPHICEISRTYLEEAGYKVWVAHDGEEAIEMYKHHQKDIDMLILDVLMPNKNGKEAFDEIKNMESNIPVLFCSGYTMNLLKSEHDIDLRAQLLKKPFNKRELLHSVRQILDIEKRHSK